MMNGLPLGVERTRRKTRILGRSSDGKKMGWNDLAGRKYQRSHHAVGGSGHQNQDIHNGGSGAHFGSTRRFLKLGRDFTGSIAEKTSRAGAKSIGPVRRYKKPKIKARGPMRPQNVDSPFGKTTGDIAGLLPVTEEENKYTKKVTGYDDGLQEKLPSVYEILHHQNRMATGRMKTRYDPRDNSIRFQTGDLMWFYNPRRRKGSCLNMFRWESPYIVVSINDVVYRIRRGPKRKMKIVHLGHFMKYDSDTVGVSDRDDQN